ncbi:TetR family transcriptional regulator [Pendulispora albinea]|uniref:TetR family transcriptional regulator n=1 Tax=Pendulispora albinea TaxID=2741071 RepID=A0ABZ2LVI2_9BACT
MSKPETKRGDPVLGGRRKLMEAALHLAATTRSLASIGLREVARHAGVNPNTFYRHFKDFDDLGLAVIHELGGQLRSGLRARRQRTDKQPVSLERAQELVHETVSMGLDFVSEYRAAYVVGIREMHGGSPVLRKALRQVMDDLAAEMAEDVLDLLPPGLLDAATVRQLSHMVFQQMSFIALDYAEHPDKRDELRRQSGQFVMYLFFGAMAAREPRAVAAVASKFAGEVRETHEAHEPAADEPTRRLGEARS